MCHLFPIQFKGLIYSYKIKWLLKSLELKYFKISKLKRTLIFLILYYYYDFKIRTSKVNILSFKVNLKSNKDVLPKEHIKYKC